MPEGFCEVSHGADAALEMWAPDLPGLFHQAAKGMYALMGAMPARVNSSSRTFCLSAQDDESLLVAFLSQLLFILEQEGLMFISIKLDHKPGDLKANLEVVPYVSIQREIKAVTFNDLAIRREGQGYRVMIVFDL